MTDSTLLGLPYMDAAQSQKHITHNEALALLDLSVQISLGAMNVTAPPGSPVEGLRVHVGAGATGAFAGQAGKIAAWQDGAWRFLGPRAGWIVWVNGAQDILVFDGAVWQSVAIAVHELQNLVKLGIGTTADTANPLAAKLNAALFAARTISEGGTGDLRFTLNKALPAGTLSQVYQTNYSGRAETGLIGDDHFRIKVSADGAAWLQAMDVNPATGMVSFPSGLSGAGAGLTFKRLETFNSSGTFIKQTGDVLYHVLAAGGGGGGGAGRRSAAATQAGGGAGGNGGHATEDWLPAASVGATASITIGAGGAGGGASANSANGASGSTGGATIAFNSIARGGNPGPGGTATAGGAAASTNIDPYTTSRCRETAGGSGNASSTGSAGGAAGGNGGTGDQTHVLTTLPGGAGGTPGAPNGVSPAVPPSERFGSGGGGGASKAAAAAGNGGAGSQAGGGGGGGGGGRNGQTGGAGGNGAAGRVLIYVYG